MSNIERERIRRKYQKENLHREVDIKEGKKKKHSLLWYLFWWDD